MDREYIIKEFISQPFWWVMPVVMIAAFIAHIQPAKKPDSKNHPKKDETHNSSVQNNPPAQNNPQEPKKGDKL